MTTCCFQKGPYLAIRAVFSIILTIHYWVQNSQDKTYESILAMYGETEQHIIRYLSLNKTKMTTF